MDKKWQALEIKLKAGWSFGDACKLAGVDESTARAYANEKRRLEEFEDLGAAILGQDVLAEAISTLRELTALDPDGEVRLDAAKALLDLYRSEKKRLDARLKDKASSESPGKSVFDHWNFLKDPNV